MPQIYFIKVDIFVKNISFHCRSLLRTSVCVINRTMQGVTLLMLAAVIASVASNPIAEQESGITKECKSLCSTCGCMGFYCGEECICECDKNMKDNDSKCVSQIHENAIKMKTPYEILIQGPADSAIVQTAKELSGEKQCCKRHTDYKHNKRSSFVIYKPLGLEEFLKQTASAFNHNINKRSIDSKRSWYEGETVPFLVRPAPRGKPVKDVFLQKRSSNSDHNDFWYTKEDDQLDVPAEQIVEPMSDPIPNQSNSLSKIRGTISGLKDIFGLKKLDNIDFFSDYDKENNWLNVFGKSSTSSSNTFFSNPQKSSVFGDRIPSFLGSAKRLFNKEEADEYDDMYIS